MLFRSRQAEVARFPAWMDRIALSLPKLEVLDASAQWLGADLWKIRFAVCNSGWLATCVTQLALQHKIVRGVMFEIHLPAAEGGVALLSGKPRFEGPQLRGHAPPKSLLALAPDAEPTADRALAEWIVRAPRGACIALSAQADRAGRIETSVKLH